MKMLPGERGIIVGKENPMRKAEVRRCVSIVLSDVCEFSNRDPSLDRD